MEEQQTTTPEVSPTSGNDKKSLKTILTVILAFVLSVGTTYGVTTYLYGPEAGGPLSPVQTPPSGGKLNIDPSAPRTEACPTNGKLFTEIERDVWESRRPLYVMIENHTDSRPQSGLNEADVIYEAVAEGGITRFGAVFYCDIAAEDTVLGPVRSARTYFLDWASEYNYPLYTHVGGANCSPTDPNNSRTCQSDRRVQALEQINQYGWGGSKGNDLNQFSIGYPTFWRDYERLGRTVATEHTMYSSTEKLYSFAKTRGWTYLSPSGDEWADDFREWNFKDDEPNGSVSDISFGFWDGYKDFQVDWVYDSTSNSYKRSNGGESHIDLNTNEQIDAKVIIVQFIKEEGPVDPLKHLYYYTTGSGDAIIFQDGEATEATWSKLNREARTIFKVNGKEVELNRGKIFIEAVPAGKDVTY